jgi:hypothetical protein
MDLQMRHCTHMLQMCITGLYFAVLQRVRTEQDLPATNTFQPPWFLP